MISQGMYLELKDLDRGKTHRIEEKGAMLGPAGSDIVIDADGVATQQARIFAQKGRFYVEDLKSGVGVMVDAKRISAPFELKLAVRFAIAGHRFEVTQIAGGEARDQAPTSLESIVLEPVEVQSASAPLPQMAIVTVPQPIEADSGDDLPGGGETLGDVVVPASERLDDRHLGLFDQLSQRPDWPRLRLIIAGAGVCVIGFAVVALWPSPPPPAPAVQAIPAVPASQPAVSAAADSEVDRKETAYQGFLRKRDEIEQFLADDPVLLKRVDGALELYERLHEETARAERWRKKDKRKRVKAVDEHLREADLYEKTAPLVEELHRKLSVSRSK